LLYLGNFYSSFYHDILHWRLKEHRVYERWLRDSEWGQLFEQYGSGPLGTPPAPRRN
jgi:hypothetical protein